VGAAGGHDVEFVVLELKAFLINSKSTSVVLVESSSLRPEVIKVD
jgi:hypothetical protein